MVDTTCHTHTGGTTNGVGDCTHAGPLRHRDREQATIGAFVDEVRAGRSAALVIEGERGAGKTAMLRAAARRADEFGTVLLARCHPSERDFPFAMVRQLFDRPVSGAQAQDTPAGTAVHGMLDGYFQTARSLATNRPVIIALDDVGTADLPSLQWCAYLARRLDGLAVAMIVTSDVDGRGCEELLGDLRALPFCRSIRPRPLCGSCSHDVLEEEYGREVDSGLAAACHEVARGNPLILRKLARRIVEAAVPPDDSGDKIADYAAETLADTALIWLGERDPDSLALAEGLAVLGERGGLETAAVLRGGGEAAAARTRLVLRRAGLLGDQAPDRFRHGFVRTAILRLIGKDRQHELHERAAALLYRLGAPPRHVATQLMSLGPAERTWAVPLLRQAARDADAADEWPEAAGYLRRALAEHTDPGPELSRTVLAELAAIELGYNLPGCVHHSEAALSLAPDDAGRVLAAVATPVFTLAVPDPAALFGDAAEHLADGLDARLRPGRADRHGVPAEWDQLLLTTAQALLAGRTTTTRPAARLGMLVRDRPAAQVFRAAVAVASAAGGRPRARVRRLCARSGAGATAARGAPDSSSLALAALAEAWAEEFADAERLVRSAVRTARSIPDQSLARLVHADLAYRRGDLAGGLNRALDAARSAEKSGATNLYAAAAATAARIHLERGEPDAARVLLRAGPADTSHPLLWSTHALSRGMLAEADRDHGEALRWFVECGRRLTAAGITNPACSPWRSLAATAHLDLGEVKAARAIAEDEVRLAQRWGARGALGRALSVAGAARAGRDGLVLQIRAVELLAHPEHRLEYARALVRLGVAEQEAGSAATARDTFAKAMQAAIACGAARLAEEAGARIRRRGSGPRRHAAVTGSLTSQELRVAELVVTGLSNVEVANALLISRRTVDTHLVHMYRKLGIRSRRGLEDFLHGRRDAPVTGAREMS